MTASELFAAIAAAASDEPVRVRPTSPDADSTMVLENGIREIAGEVRNSLDFHRSQEGGGEVSHVVLSGAALDVPGFADALQADLGVAGHARDGPRHRRRPRRTTVSPQRLAVAAGLAVEEAPR